MSVTSAGLMSAAEIVRRPGPKDWLSQAGTNTMIDFQYFFHFWILTLLSGGGDSEVRQYKTAAWSADINGGNSEPQVSAIGVGGSMVCGGIKTPTGMAVEGGAEPLGEHRHERNSPRVPAFRPLLRRSRGATEGQTAIQKYQEAAVPCKSMGQTAIEYMLMLAIVAALITIFGMLFNRKLLGGFFSMVGMIIGEGLGKT